jgi:hypothetical protein
MPGHQHTEEYKRYINESDDFTILNDRYHQVRHIDPDGIYENLNILCKSHNISGWVYEYNIRCSRPGCEDMHLGLIQYCPVCGLMISATGSRYKSKRKAVEKHITPDEERRKEKRAQRVQNGSARALKHQREEREMLRWKNLDI